MQPIYLAAGLIAALTGVAHSVLGERLIFRHVRSGGLIPDRGAPPLRERHLRILWATWHLGSVFGWAFAGVLIGLAFRPASIATLSALVNGALVFAYLGGSVLVLFATKGRHPGWIALMAVAILAWIGSRI